jgi:hypothetical protein
MRVKNVSRSSITVNLLRGVDYGEGYRPTAFSLHQATATDSGEVGIRLVEMSLPGSITWRAGEEKDVPDAVDRIPEFRKARSAGRLRVAT